MKKITVLFLSVILFYSCLSSDNDVPNLGFELLPIDEYTTPDSFIFGQNDTIKLKYTLKDGCAFFDNIYYEYEDTSRIVAIKSVVDLDATCLDSETQYDYNLIVTATQEEDYLFKFYKGRDASGNNIFEEVIVPVN